MMHFIRSLVSVFLLTLFVVMPSAQSALNAYDRQELAFENALADKNPGFESGVTQWTASGGTFVSNSGTQIVPNSKQYATWDSNSASQTLQTAAVTVPKTGNCEFSIWIAVPSGTATHTITVTDGSNDLVLPQTITNNTNALKHIVNFPCPASGTVRGKLTSVASNEPSISLDNARLGSATNVGTVQQAIYKGSLLMTGCTDWSVSNTSFANFTATAGCSYTATGDVLSPSTFIPGFRLQNVAPGRYMIIARGYFGKSVTTTNADISFRFSDGTSTFAERVAISAASSSGQAIGVGELTATIGYTTTQSTLTFQIQGQTSSTASSTAAVISDDGGANATAEFGGLQFEVFYFPTNQQTVVNQADQGWFASGEITGANPSLGTAAVTSPTEITNGSLTLTPSTNSAAVGIACATGTTSVIGSYTCGVNESFGFITNVPRSGVYEVCFGYTVSGATGNTVTLQVSKTPAASSTPDLNGEQRTSFYNSSTTVAIGSTHRNCSNFTLSSGSNTFRLSYEQDAATNAPAIIADGNTSLGQRNFSFSIKPVNSQQQAVLANSVIARDAVNGQVTTVNTVVSKSTTYTATANEETILASTSGGAWTLSLPAASGLKGKKYHIKLLDDTANALTIDPNSSETICDQTTVTMRGLRDTMVIQSDGTEWVGLDGSCWRTNGARLDCDSGSTVPVDRQRLVSTLGNISGGTCALTLNTGNYSGSPTCVVSWNGTATSSDFYAVCSSATSCAVGGGGAVTTAQIDILCWGPR